jgi:type II secretory pathway pseudopilin PulG
MKTKRQAGFTLLDLLLAAGAVAAVATLIIVLIVNIREKGESHPATTESYKVAGVALCEELHGNTPTWAACMNQVLTEWARAVSTQSAFNKAAVPSIPAAKWP